MDMLLIMLIANSFLLLLTAIFFALASSKHKSNQNSYHSEYNVSKDIEKIKSQIDGADNSDFENSYF